MPPLCAIVKSLIMENILEEFEESSVIYGTFWQRFQALFMDGLILSPAILFDWYNKTSLKSPWLLITIALLATIYKPFMEYKYGSTLGKKMLNLRVVNKDFQNPSLLNILLRNVFDILERLITLVIVLIVFSMPEFQQISLMKDFTNLQNSVVNNTLVIFIPLVLVIIEIVFLLTDKQKRALHDWIGSTLVIKY